MVGVGLAGGGRRSLHCACAVIFVECGEEARQEASETVVASVAESCAVFWLPSAFLRAFSSQLFQEGFPVASSRKMTEKDGGNFPRNRIDLLLLL